MNPDMFVPTLDWDNELWKTVVWVGRAWAIAAVITMLILILIVQFTKWGKQYWRITGDYFKGRDSVIVWIWLAGLLLSVIAGVHRCPAVLPRQRHDVELPGGRGGP